MSMAKTSVAAVFFLLVGVLMIQPVIGQDNPEAVPDTVQPSQPVDSLSDAHVTDTIAAGAASVYPMSPDRKAKLISYSRFVNIWRFVGFFVTLGLMALILFTGFSARMQNWAGVVKKKFLMVWLFLILFLIVDYLLNFPFHFYRSFIVENQYGFLNLSFGEWFAEDMLGLLVTAIVGVVPLWFLYWLIARSRKWWLWASLAAVPFAVFMIVIAPIVIDPLFNKFEPLKDKALEAELLTLAEKAGIEGSDVFQVDASKQSTKINAYVTGLFATKRIVLYDTMIDNFETDEILFVMGHEMGHYLMHHMWKGLALAVILIALALWIISRTIQPVIDRFKHRFKFDRLDDIASLPLIVIFVAVLSFLMEPISNGASRYMERQSDKFAMDVSRVSAESAEIAFDKLSVFNLSDPDPHPLIEFWFYSHPALSKRINFVRNYKPSGT